MDWRNYIHPGQRNAVGMPVLKGTRLPVNFVVRLLAADWAETRLRDTSPELTLDVRRAITDYADEAVAREALYVVPGDARFGGARETAI